MKTKIMMLILLISGHLASGAILSFEFESSVDDLLKNSFGQDLDATFTFQIGSFQAGFNPANEALSSWNENWYVFDQADFAASPPTIGIPDGGINDAGNTVSTHENADNTFNFFEKEAYLWVYNSLDIEAPGTEWFLARAPGWTFPASTDPSCCPGDFIQWSLQDINNSTETPVFGSQDEYEGGGTATVNNPNQNLQTHAIPEPGALVMLGAMLSSLGLLYTCRNRRSL